MQKFKNFLEEQDRYDPDENQPHEQYVQDKIFDVNDYIPFKTDELKESFEQSENPKNLIFRATPGEHTAANGLVVPKHAWVGKPATKKVPPIMGMDERNEHRAKVYGSEHRPPIGKGKIEKIHNQILTSHFTKPLAEQIKAEKSAIDRLQAAKHLDSGSTLDAGEKTDTVQHEFDEQGRRYRAMSSKGVAGHALYTSGVGDNQKHHIINTCPAQTTGCGGGLDSEGIADTLKGTCFAPKAERRLPIAAIRRATHEQAKHDPAMTGDWILAHAHSIRRAAKSADNANERFLYRPNVVDETDNTSRILIKHLNKQREKEGRPPIVGNGYGKTNEMHDPENHWHTTYSNVGPKVKHGREVTENKKRDAARIRETITATDVTGKNKVNDEGNATPPKGSYMLNNVKRDSDLDKRFQKHVTHAKYWSSGREEHELSDAETKQGLEGHYDGKGKPTTPSDAHYGHITIKGEDGKNRRYDYQKQHILHPRLVNVNGHLIPTDSRFKDEEFLPKQRFKSRNGKNAGALLITTPTKSTSNEQHDSSFTHHVDNDTIEHAKMHNGEYEVDSPSEQEKARGKEFAMAQPLTFKKKVAK